MQKSEILKKARRLINRPEHWTKCSLARDIAGQPALIGTPAAVSFCAIGAVSAVSVSGVVRHADTAWVAAEYVLPLGVMAFNDSPKTTHNDILTFFDVLISLALGEEIQASEGTSI